MLKILQAIADRYFVEPRLTPELDAVRYVNKLATRSYRRVLRPKAVLG